MPLNALQTSDYASVPQKESDEDPPSPPIPPPHSLFTIRSLSPWIAHTLLVLINIFTFIYITQLPPSETSCSRLLSPWSPALDAIRYLTIPISPSSQPSNPFTAPPSPSTDAAWTNITTALPLLKLSSQDLAHLSKTPATVLTSLDAPDSYVGNLEVYELLHCLDQVRKATRHPHGEEVNEAEVERCVEALRQDLMCKADVSVLTFPKEGAVGASPDFGAVRRCRDFGAIMEWSRRNGRALA